MTETTANYVPRVSVETDVDADALDLQANLLMSVNGLLHDSDFTASGTLAVTRRAVAEALAALAAAQNL